MSGVRIDPAAATAELGEFNQRAQRVRERLQALAARPLEAAPRELVWQSDKVRLYRYGHCGGPPVLIVYALINRPSMLDLQPSRSLIRRLSEQGLDVYLIDWGRPDMADRALGLADYVDDYLAAAVDVVCRLREVDALNLLGVCQGGVLSLCYAARRPERVASLVTMVTPVDFHAGSQPLLKLLSRIDVDAFVRVHGNIPGAWMSHLFTALQPLRLGQQKYLDLVDQIDSDEQLQTFLRMEQWIHDSPDLAARAFLEFASGFIRDNGLVRGTARIGATAIDLSRLDMPLLNIYATRDHIVPPASSRALRGLVRRARYTELAVKGGHIGIYVSRSAQQVVPGAIVDWLGRFA